MPIGNIEPTPFHPDEPPFVCVKLNKHWIPYLIGALKPLKYPEYWAGTLEQNRQARWDTNNLIWRLMIAVECGEDEVTIDYCCEDMPRERRVNPITLQFEISFDGGETWLPDPEGLDGQIVEQPPPVTSGVSATKCDAATNGKQHIEDIIASVHTNLATGGTILSFALAVAEAILAIILFFASAGALAALATALATACWAAFQGVYNIGLTAFDDYWTSDERDKILCALYCNISDNGSFDQVGYDKFLSDWKADATPSLAFNAVFTATKAVGLKGLNNMCSYGEAADADCSDCECNEPCDLSHWSIDPSGDGSNGTIDSFDEGTGDLIISSTIPKSDGRYYVVFSTSRVYGANSGCYCNTNLTCNFTDRGTAWEAAIPSGGLMQNHCVNHVGVVHDAPFTETINFGDCP